MNRVDAGTVVGHGRETGRITAPTRRRRHTRISARLAGTTASITTATTSISAASTAPAPTRGFDGRDVRVGGILQQKLHRGDVRRVGGAPERCRTSEIDAQVV